MVIHGYTWETGIGRGKQDDIGGFFVFGGIGGTNPGGLGCLLFPMGMHSRRKTGGEASRMVSFSPADCFIYAYIVLHGMLYHTGLYNKPIFNSS